MVWTLMIEMSATPLQLANDAIKKKRRWDNDLATQDYSVVASLQFTWHYIWVKIM